MNGTATSFASRGPSEVEQACKAVSFQQGVWYQYMALVMMTRKAISALEVRRQFDMKNYRPAWDMMYKTRIVMGQRDYRCGLEPMVKFDEGYFSTLVKKGT